MTFCGSRSGLRSQLHLQSGFGVRGVCVPSAALRVAPRVLLGARETRGRRQTEQDYASAPVPEVPWSSSLGIRLPLMAHFRMGTYLFSVMYVSCCWSNTDF